jgi:hypothetical protein
VALTADCRFIALAGVSTGRTRHGADVDTLPAETRQTPSSSAGPSSALGSASSRTVSGASAAVMSAMCRSGRTARGRGAFLRTLLQLAGVAAGTGGRCGSAAVKPCSSQTRAAAAHAIRPLQARRASLIAAGASSPGWPCDGVAPGSVAAASARHLPSRPAGRTAASTEYSTAFRLGPPSFSRSAHTSASEPLAAEEAPAAAGDRSSSPARASDRQAHKALQQLDLSLPPKEVVTRLAQLRMKLGLPSVVLREQAEPLVAGFVHANAAQLSPRELLETLRVVVWLLGQKHSAK